MFGATTEAQPPKDAPDEPSDVGTLAGKAAGTMFGRGIAVRAIGLVGTLIAARILGPYGLGLLAMGFTINAAATVLTDGGLGRGLIRQREDPTPRQLRAVLGFQLTLGFAVASIVTAVGLNHGTLGGVTAVMVWCVPAMSLRTPAVIISERKLQYGTQAKADVAQAIVSNGFATVALLAGSGVWGVAVGTVLGSLTAGLMTMFLIPGGRMLPLLSLRPIRDQLSYGAWVQASLSVSLIRDQGLNLGIAAIGGPAMLGIWSLAVRLLQVPYLLIMALSRVSFPALSKRLNAGGDAQLTVIKLLGIASVALGLVLAPLGASSSTLVPLLFGAEWKVAGEIIVPICAVLATTGAISIGCVAFLSYAGRVRAMLIVTIVNTITWLAITLSLLKPVGPMAVAIGFAAASTVESIGFTWIARSESVTRIGFTAIHGAMPGLTGGAIGFAVAEVLDTQSLAAMASALLAAVVAYVASRWTNPKPTLEIIENVRRVARRA